MRFCRFAAACCLIVFLSFISRPADGAQSGPVALTPAGGSPGAGQKAASPPGSYQVAQAAQGLGEGLEGAWRRLVEMLTPQPGPVGDPLLAAGRWFEERFQLVRFNVEGVFTVSEFQTGSKAGPLEGGRFSGVFAPGLRLTEDTGLVFVYNGAWNRELQVFTEDEGPRQRSEEQRHELILLLSQDYQKPFGGIIPFLSRLTVSPSVFQTYVFTRQTAAEDWGNGNPLGGVQKFRGLYDYWDRGVGLEVKLTHDGGGERRDTLSLASQAYLRHYRNFVSLAHILNPGTFEPKFEKDYFGVLARAIFEHQNPEGLSLRLGWTHLNRRFTEDRADENPLIEAGQLLTGELRRDVTNTFEWRATHPIAFVRGLTVGLGGNVSYNRSNAGFNDTLAPLSAVGAFTEHYYDYWSFGVSPEASLTRPVSFQLFGLGVRGLLTLGANYSFDRRAYRDRKAKDKDGGFRDGGVGDKDATEVDYLHIISPRLIFQFHKNWVFLLEAKRTIARSNFEDERTFRYNYDINSIGVGVQYRF